MTRATGLAEWPVTISDGTTTVGLMWPNKTGIRQLPRGAGVERKTVRQQTWNGGRGADRLANDTSRYFDAMNAWTMVDGQWVPGPLMRLTKTRDEVIADAPVGDFGWNLTSGKFARSFVAPASFTVRRLAVMLRINDLEADDPAVAICSNSAGAPGVELWAGTVDAAAQDTVGQWQVFDPNLALVSGTTYWVVVDVALPPNATETHAVVVGLDSEANGKSSDGGGGWSDATSAPLFYLTAADVPLKRVHFFRYQQQLYAMRERVDRAASDVLINGDRGVATGAGQTTRRLYDTTKTWTPDEWVGCVLYVVSGPNKGLWRSIEANGTTYLNVAEDWPTAFTTGASGSVYVILGSDKWTAITGGLAAACTSVAVCGGVVYFATGDATVMRRMREYNNAGVWTREFADDGTNKAEWLLSAPHHTDATASVYRANNDTSTVSVAKKTTWGTALTFETALEVGDVETRISSLRRYDNQVWAVKDDSVWALDNGKFGEVEIGMQAARDERNGVAATGWNTNFYFGFMDGFERLYGKTVDDIGPNRDMGMPEGRRGYVADCQAALQYLYVAHDAGEGVSCVLCSTSPGGSWHELARAREAGQPIGSVYYQTVPGLTNKLWIMHGADIGYLVMPDDTHNPIGDAAMRYAPECYVTSAWIDLDSPELDHYFDEVRVMSRNLSRSRSLKLQYKVNVDDDELSNASSPRTAAQAWTTFGGEDVTSSPLAVRAIGDGKVTGRRLRLRAVMTCDTHEAQVINWLEVRANQMNEVLYQYVFDVTVDDRMMLLNGNDSTDRAAEVLEQLQAWQETATLLTMRIAPPAGGSIMDNVCGHIDPVGLVVAEWNDEHTRLSGSVTFMQT